jgi:hypothetical protein
MNELDQLRAEAEQLKNAIRVRLLILFLIVQAPEVASGRCYQRDQS